MSVTDAVVVAVVVVFNVAAGLWVSLSLDDMRASIGRLEERLRSADTPKVARARSKPARPC